MNKWVIGLIALVVLAGGWFYFSQPKAAEGEPIKIGVILPLTGNAAKSGADSLAAIEIAREDFGELTCSALTKKV